MSELKKVKSIHYGSGRDHILRAAAELFAEKGFSNTTLKDVAEVSGANTALVSYYFGSKEGLRKAVLSDEIERIFQLLAPLDKASTMPYEAIQNMFEDRFQQIEQSKSFHNLCSWSMMEGRVYSQELNELLWIPAIKMFHGSVKKLNGALTDVEVDTRCVIMCSFIQKYAELIWHKPSTDAVESDRTMVLAEFKKYFFTVILPSLLAH